MSEIRPQSEQKERSQSPIRRPPRSRRHPGPSRQRPTDRQEEISPSGLAVRRHVLDQLTIIQLSTAGLSGPYRTDEETMERVCASHDGVRALRVVLRRSLLIPRQGPLWRALLAATLNVCDGELGPAASSLGLTVHQLRRAIADKPSVTTRGLVRLSLVE